MSEFYDKHVDKVYKFFYIKSLDRSTAEDLTSETFVAFVSKNNAITISDKTKYLYGIMRTVWIEFLKRKYKENVADIEGIEDFEDYSVNIIDSFEESESPTNRLQPYVDMLPVKQRRVLTMRVLENKSVQETAEELGKDKNYVKTTYKRALQSLRTMLQEPYLQQEAQL